MSEHLHTVTFSAELNTPFRILQPSMPAVDVELVEVTEKSSVAGPQSSVAARHERFSIVFRGPCESTLQQGMYRLQHERLGVFELFLVPVGRDQGGVYYEAVFNRLRRQDG